MNCLSFLSSLLSYNPARCKVSTFAFANINMYRHSPVRNPRSKGIKIKNVLQVCLLVAVCFWLIFQVKRSHDKKKEFDATDKLTSLNTHSSEEIVKFGRKDLPHKLDEIVKEIEKHEDEHEQEEEEEQEDNKHEEEEVEEDKIDEEKDDEIDENDQEKSDVEIDREEVDIIDEDKETEESESEKENEESQTDNTVDHDEEHTHELREEHYKADDASSAVTHDGRSLGTENEIKNRTFDQTPKNETSSDIQEKDSKPLVSSVNPTLSIDSLENGPPSNTTVITSDSTIDQNVTNSTYVSENSGSDLETNNVIEGTEETLDSDSTDPSHLDEKEVRTDLDTLPEIETEGGNSEDTAAE